MTDTSVALETNRANSGSEPPSESKRLARALEQTGKQYALVLVHLSIAVLAFGAAAYYARYLTGTSPPQITDFPKEPAVVFILVINLIVGVFATYFPLVAAIWVGLKFAARANALMRAAFYEQTSVVPSKDFDLLRDAITSGNPAPVTEYIRLVSLTGGAGIFQKIGLTGLPLVTLGLVLFFACGVLFTDSASDTFKAFLDFSKLTLGAFIGSFVQRQVESRSQETELRRAVENIRRTPTTTPRADTSGTIATEEHPTTVEVESKDSTVSDNTARTEAAAEKDKDRDSKEGEKAGS